MHPAFRSAFSTLGCPDPLIEQVRSLAARSGIDAVELRTLEGALKAAASRGCL